MGRQQSEWEDSSQDGKTVAMVRAEQELARWRAQQVLNCEVGDNCGMLKNRMPGRQVCSQQGTEGWDEVGRCVGARQCRAV